MERPPKAIEHCLNHAAARIRRTRIEESRLKAIAALALLVAVGAASVQDTDMSRWRARAANVTIVRDDWGIAHVRGKTDADAVFGAIYAQAEDDFNRVETNYLTALGRRAEAEGPNALAVDLRQRLFIDPDQLRADYARSPPWLVALMNAWA